jgi:WD40 repeat protein
MDLPPIEDFTLSDHAATIRSLCFSPVDDNILVSGDGSDTNLRVWNLERQELV